ncbi:MAG: IS110 family transposase [Desulfomonilaceae bacterium]
MAKKEDTRVIEVLHPICCGLDVHKETVAACLIVQTSTGERIEHREFGTFTHELRMLKQWLLDNECPVVAIESTGVYWRPVFNVLEGSIQVILVNARHTKHMPGRKTDMSDSKWLAGLLRHGLVRGSFIPGKEVRQWRDWCRQRKTLVDTVSDFKRRVHKTLEMANIKIDSVLSDLFGATGWNLIQLLMKDSPITLDDVGDCLRGSLARKDRKQKAAQLHDAIQGFFGDHEREVLQPFLRIIGALENEIALIEVRLQRVFAPYQNLIQRIDPVPGIAYVAAWAILAEVGPTLEGFRTVQAFCSWCGLSPGNHESAGKRKNTRSPVRNKMIKTVLIEVAWAAIKNKKSYYRDKYFRLKGRLGSKKAIVAIAHRIAKALFHIIKHGAEFKDLGKDYLSLLHANRRYEYLQREAKVIGYKLVAVPV